MGVLQDVDEHNHFFSCCGGSSRVMHGFTAAYACTEVLVFSETCAKGSDALAFFRMRVANDFY